MEIWGALDATQFMESPPLPSDESLIKDDIEQLFHEVVKLSLLDTSRYSAIVVHLLEIIFCFDWPMDFLVWETLKHKYIKIKIYTNTLT